MNVAHRGLQYDGKATPGNCNDYFLLVSLAVGHGHNKVPLPHYDNFFDHFLQSGKKNISESPPPP